MLLTQSLVGSHTVEPHSSTAASTTAAKSVNVSSHETANVKLNFMIYLRRRIKVIGRISYVITANNSGELSL